jgi:hypothetical protein
MVAHHTIYDLTILVSKQSMVQGCKQNLPWNALGIARGTINHIQHIKKLGLTMQSLQKHLKLKFELSFLHVCHKSNESIESKFDINSCVDSCSKMNAFQIR